jgi:phosphoenolpyruvate-protein phosphotransferase (PTS system enzyme I)
VYLAALPLEKSLFTKKPEKKLSVIKWKIPNRSWNVFHHARQIAINQLDELYKKALTEVGEANAAILSVHQMMLNDLDYLDSIENIITNQGVNAEYAVGVTGDNFSRMFSSMDDEYMKERAADVQDISNRVIRVLSKEDNNDFYLSEPAIIAAEDLDPSETVQLDKNKVLSFITRKGSSNSHTAILARTMNIPAVIGVGEDLKEEYDGKLAVVDGFTGTIYIEPEESLLKEMKSKKQQDEEKKALLQELKGKENITKDGQKINIYANIGNSADIGAVLQNDAGGIGLFRSEFLYLEKDTFPTEEEQFFRL